MNMKNDLNGLGVEIRSVLVEHGLESPSPVPTVLDHDTRKQLLSDHFKRVLELLGLDLADDSLRGTPDRIATMFLEEVFHGLNYANFPRVTTVSNNMKYDEMIATKCQVRSFCEHHFVPFTGQAHVAYIPNSHVLGLSKFNRVVDFFSRRPQIQERLTEQISCALKHILQTDDVAVVIEAEHLCVQLRGVQDECSSTITSKLSGRFRSVPEARSEFLALTRSTS